jgi:hypothetical protein
MAFRNKAARNERRKFTSGVNNSGVAFIVTGIVVPSVSFAYQMTLPQTQGNRISK